jgi:hypothetical protein
MPLSDLNTAGTKAHARGDGMTSKATLVPGTHLLSI